MLNRYLPGILSLFPEKKFRRQEGVVITPSVPTYVPHEGDVFVLERRGTSWILNEECNEWVLGGDSSWVLTSNNGCP